MLTYDDLRAQWPRPAGEESLSMRSLKARVEDPADPLNLHPDYQRSRAWTDDQCAKFIGFLLEGGTAPPLWVQRWKYDTGLPDEMLDGLQRATAVLRFLNNEVPFETIGGVRMYLRDMSERDQRLICSHAGGPTLTVRYVQYENRADVLRFYLRLNRGGTPHSDAEIERVQELLRAEVG